MDTSDMSATLVAILRRNATRYQNENEKNCPLLRLPAELRNQIYVYILLPDSSAPIEIRCDKTSMSERRSYFTRYLQRVYFEDEPESLQRAVIPAPPAIIQTCTRIRQETTPIYYGERTFVFPDTGLYWCDHLVDFLGKLGPERTAMLRKVVLHEDAEWENRSTAMHAVPQITRNFWKKGGGSDMSAPPEDVRLRVWLQGEVAEKFTSRLRGLGLEEDHWELRRDSEVVGVRDRLRVLEAFDQDEELVRFIRRDLGYAQEELDLFVDAIQKMLEYWKEGGKSETTRSLDFRWGDPPAWVCEVRDSKGGGEPRSLRKCPNA